MKFKSGTTRITILIGRLAFKIPIMNSLKYFVKGWLGNIDERDAWKNYDKKGKLLCPVYFSLAGLINIMPKAEPVVNIDFDKQWALNFYKDAGVHIDVCSGWKNFGYIKNVHQPVLLDYATCRESNEYCSGCDHNCTIK